MKKDLMSVAEILEAKKKYGDIFKITVDGKEAIIRKPNRKDLSHATAVGGNDPFAFNETLLNDCWLTGDEEIKTNDDYFLAVSGQLDKIIEIKEAEIKKL